MTGTEVAWPGGAFASFLRAFYCCLSTRRTFENFVTYCRGLWGQIRRKAVEPIALAAGSSVRALQWFLSNGKWDHERLRDMVQQRVATLHCPVPGTLPLGQFGATGVIDETRDDKQGNKTPGGQRQYLGCPGKTDNGVVTVRLCLVDRRFKSIIDSDRFLPESWGEDRQRCEEAGIPADLHHQPKTDIALEQVRRAFGNGVRFSFLDFDGGYGKSPVFLFGLDKLGQTHIGEIPKSFHCFGARPKYVSLQRPFQTKPVQNLCWYSPLFRDQPWHEARRERETLGVQLWRVKAAPVYLRSPERTPDDRTYWLVIAWQPESNEYKYFISNAPSNTPLITLVKMAFTRWHVEHSFRAAKREIGFMDYEGRCYGGLMKHLALCMLAMLFIADQTADKAAFPP